ncbi:MAG: Crp/Fnr family transcriptional regulator [Rhodomicrobium sp.]|nr:Crp/Fnr family transcriptional regulator [Rhodomicrobium sp.]
MHGVCTRCEACPIRQAGICGILSDEELTKLGRVARRRHIKAHQPIFLDGDDADQYFNVVEGIVKLVKTSPDGKQHIVGLMYPPDFLGEPLNRQHSYTAEAATDVELCSFPRSQFEALIDAHPKLERRLLELTVHELEICRNWTLLLSRKSSYERVASFLYMMAKRVPAMGCAPRPDGPISIVLPFTRSEMADYLGLTLETVSRQMSRLKAKR